VSTPTRVRQLAHGVAALCAAVLLPAGAAAQARVIERHTIGDPEGRLMGYYAAALAFSPLGAPAPAAPWSTDLALEVSYVPPLSASQRSLGGAKTESTNLAPAFPRPRLRVSLPRQFVAEVSWVPPVRAFDATANLFGVALSHAGVPVRGIAIAPRLAFSAGRVTGAITCNRQLRAHGGGDSIYFERICFGNQSEDRFEPRALSAEVVASRALRAGSLRPWAALGVRRERDRFDVGVICDGTFCPEGERDPGNPILEMRTTRAYGAVGATWWPLPRAALGAELFWLPGSVATARVLASWRLHDASVRRERGTR
jgi:hypothetical protein